MNMRFGKTLIYSFNGVHSINLPHDKNHIKLVTVISFPKRNILIHVNNGHQIKRTENLITFGKVLNIKKWLDMPLSPLEDATRRWISFEYNNEYILYKKNLQQKSHMDLEKALQVDQSLFHVDLIVFCMWYIRKVFENDTIICSGLSTVNLNVTDSNSWHIERHYITINCNTVLSMNKNVSTAINTWVKTYLKKTVTFHIDDHECFPYR